MKLNLFIFLTAGLLLLAGCGGYYKVTDPNSQKTYYTQKISRKTDGRIEFKDAKTGSEVVLQSSEVLKIKSREYKAGTSKE